MMAAVLIALLLLPSGCGAFTPRLNDDNYEQMTAGKSIFLRLMDPPNCPTCEESSSFSSDWERLSLEWEGHPYGLVSEVDCSNPDSYLTCEDNDVIGVESGFALVFGEPDSPRVYNSAHHGLDYDSLSTFAEQHLSEPSCSAYETSACGSDERAVIDALSETPMEVLEQVRENVENELEEASDTYFGALRELDKQYEALFRGLDDRVTAIIDENNYKFVRQILVQKRNKEEEEEASSAAAPLHPDEIADLLRPEKKVSNQRLWKRLFGRSSTSNGGGDGGGDGGGGAGDDHSQQQRQQQQEQRLHRNETPELFGPPDEDEDHNKRQQRQARRPLQRLFGKKDDELFSSPRGEISNHHKVGKTTTTTTTSSSSDAAASSS